MLVLTASLSQGLRAFSRLGTPRPRKALWRLAAVIGLVALIHSGAALAQQPAAPFSAMTVRAGAALNVDRGRLHSFWKRGYGAFAEIGMPFYVGRIEGGGAWHRYEDRADAPRFDAVFAFLGWRGRWQPLSRLRLSAGPRLGNYLMLFGESRLSGLERESEMMVALNARIAVRVAGGWHAFVAGSYQKLFTARRIRLGYVTFGLSRDLTTPGWLRSLLE